MRGDDTISIDVPGTALDVLANTEHLVVGGSNMISLLTVGSAGAFTRLKLRSNRNLVRLLKFNPLTTGHFASVSGQFIDVYYLGQGPQIQRIGTFKAHSRKVSDFCWCPFDEQLMMTCAEADSVAIWDLRTDLRQSIAQLGVTSGAGQSKFAPHLNNYLLTTHGTDVRLWDLKYTSQPIVQFTAHQNRILCLDWHPHHQLPNSFFTSANDSALKLWNMTDQRSAPSLVSVAPFSAWRLVFSHEGEELAALGLPPTNALALCSNYGLDNFRFLKGIERETLMDAAWQKSTTAQKSTTKYLYTLSTVKQKLRRHPIAYEISNVLRDEMATPITQSKTDEERDRLVAAAEQSIDPELLHVTGSSLGDGNSALVEKMEPHQQQQHSRMPTENRNSLASGRSVVVGSVKSATIIGLGGGTTPQSPIYSEWQRWIRAPNLAGGDLLTELEALRKHTTEGLYTTEVNFTRAAIGFSYMHLNKFRKINFEMRFHREFIENGLVFVEVLQKDSPFTPEKASLFLTLLQQESDEQQKTSSDQTILCRVLQQLPRIIDLMKLFTPSMDIPSLSKASSQSGSAGEEQLLSTLGTNDALTVDQGILSTTSRSISAAVPCSYIPSPYDHRVPAPRNSGARFNRSGYLVAFGPVTTTFPVNNTGIGDIGIGGLMKEGIPRIVPPTKGRKVGTSRLGSTRSQPSEGKQQHPRSLAEYCVFVNPTPPINLRQTSSTSTAFFQNSPPVRCISPGAALENQRPASPWQRADDSEEAMPTKRHNQQQQQNSLSPPSLLRQNLASTIESDQDEGGSSQARPIVGASRTFGTSPNSSAIRSFSLQNVAHSMRHRGSSMSGAPNTATSTGEPPTIAASTTTATGTLLTQQQSVIEHGSSGPTAVMPELSFNTMVFVYDATTLLPISKSLAQSYKLLGPPLEICRNNFEQASKQGRKDLMNTWKLLEQCMGAPGMEVDGADPAEERLHGVNDRHKFSQFARLFRLDQNKISRALDTFNVLDIPWAVHPLGRELVNRLLEHYTSKCDLQTAAVIACLFSISKNKKKSANLMNRTSSSTRQMEAEMPTSSSATDCTILSTQTASFQHPPSRKTSAALPSTSTIMVSTNTAARPFAVDNFGPNRIKQSADNRLSPAPEHYLSSSSPSPKTAAYPLPQKDSSSELFLDPALSNRFEELKRKYADILYRWRMYKKCAEVLKHCTMNSSESTVGTIKAVSWCSFCGQQPTSDDCTRCSKCRRPPIYCAICEQPCRGIIATCTSCSHGGHFLHISDWFESQSQCPLGCGCECKF